MIVKVDNGKIEVATGISKYGYYVFDKQGNLIDIQKDVNVKEKFAELL